MSVFRDEVTFQYLILFAFWYLKYSLKKKNRQSLFIGWCYGTLAEKKIASNEFWELRETFKAHEKRKNRIFSTEFQLPHNLTIDYTLVTCGQELSYF